MGVRGPAGGLMVCGTGSDSGKSTVVAGLCRLLARKGVRVAPFKAQNMALNSAVTASGHEIGRAQAAQARAARVEPHVDMNPVLLKPTGSRTSQVIVGGRPWATLDSRSYQSAKQELWPVVCDALGRLRESYDAVICEGAGSPAEINLLAGDLVNLRLAVAAGLPAVLVGDIDRGGVFAALYGTIALLPDRHADAVKAFVINKFRGDPALLESGLIDLQGRTGRPTVGVIPWLEGIDLDAEDSLALPDYGAPGGAGGLDVAVIQLPRISNFTDFDPLVAEPSVTLRLVRDPRDLGRPDLVVVPGSKATVSDLDWLRLTGLASALSEIAVSGTTTLLGICAGLQMLGREIVDAVESDPPRTVAGLGLLPVRTVFDPQKVTRRVRGRGLGNEVHGYEIRHGRVEVFEPAERWIHLESEGGAAVAAGPVFGTSMHGLFEADGFRRAFLAGIARRAGRGWEAGGPLVFDEVREARIDRLADTIEAHVDTGFIFDLIDGAGS